MMHGKMNGKFDTRAGYSPITSRFPYELSF